MSHVGDKYARHSHSKNCAAFAASHLCVHQVGRRSQLGKILISPRWRCSHVSGHDCSVRKLEPHTLLSVVLFDEVLGRDRTAVRHGADSWPGPPCPRPALSSLLWAASHAAGAAEHEPTLEFRAWPEASPTLEKRGRNH